MDFDYVLADPTGNVTVLITSPYTENTRASMIQEAFAKEPACEQVGFVMPCGDKRIRIEMMAYEFCGNATLSSAALLMHSSAPSTGSEDTVTVDSSGAGRPVVVSLRRLPDLEENGQNMPVYQGTLSMPVPEVSSFRGYPLISFEGISHLLVPASDYTDKDAEAAVRIFAEELGVSALGMMLYTDSGASDGLLSDSLSIRPLVFVPGSGTLFWEHGCATGSTAVGWYRYYSSGYDTSTEIKQPGGIIRVDAAGGQISMTASVIFRSFHTHHRIPIS